MNILAQQKLEADLALFSQKLNEVLEKFNTALTSVSSVTTDEINTLISGEMIQNYQHTHNMASEDIKSQIIKDVGDLIWAHPSAKIALIDQALLDSTLSIATPYCEEKEALNADNENFPVSNVNPKEKFSEILDVFIKNTQNSLEQTNKQLAVTIEQWMDNYLHQDLPLVQDIDDQSPIIH